MPRPNHTPVSNSSPLVHPFLFFGRPDRGRQHTCWQARDVLFLPHLLDALRRQGYALGETILNMPPQNGDDPRSVRPVPIRLGVSDVLLILTRFPLHDDPTDVKCILRGYTEPEPRVLEVASWIFAFLNRKKVLLQRKLWSHVRPGFENRVNIRYFQQLGARFSELRDAERGRAEEPPGEPTTSAFLLNAPLGAGGPRLIAAFAMDAISTIAWTQILAHRHPEWLAEPGFTMVDLARREVPPRPTLLSFPREWRTEIVVQLRPERGESEGAFWARLGARPEPSPRA